MTTTAAPMLTRFSRPFLAVLVALAVVTAGGLAYVLQPAAPLMVNADATPAPTEKPIFVTLEPMTVNLQSEGRPRFLHIGMALRVRSAKAQERVNAVLPELRSRVLLLLSNRAPDSLATPEDKARLAEEILQALNRPLGPGQAPQEIVSVSFHTFVVQ